MEQNGRFRLLDLGAKNFTRVNSHIVREPILLEPDDEIQFGDQTILRFITSTH
jgi:pSer/pThr/pTyr-binding forkhead associated (FHA) protein